MALILYKIIFTGIFALIGFYNPPFNTNSVYGAIWGAGFAAGLLLIVFKIKNTDLKYIWSAIVGIIFGSVTGITFFKLFSYMTLSFSAVIFFKAIFLIGIPITGMFIGLAKPNMFTPLNIREFFRGSSVYTESYLLDTSAIIDGRIVPIVQSGFIEGELIITQFVLAELQLIADSSDPNKKIRGRRGLDIIELLRKNAPNTVTILNKNVAGVKEVDQKLVLMAKDSNFKIITNDINLSKIAKLQDIKVLNVNELAFALKPVVHPGEILNVHIAKEGKEKKQGLAYLDDGTMIVIDDAKNEIGKNIKIEVTSVLQSTSGKMIFGKKA